MVHQYNQAVAAVRSKSPAAPSHVHMDMVAAKLAEAGLVEAAPAWPQLHEEYSQAFPGAPASHFRDLETSLSMARGQALGQLMLHPSGAFDDLDMGWPQGRWGPFKDSPELASFLRSDPKPGDAFFSAARPTYQSPFRASFSNMTTAATPLQLGPGEVHVAVGFVDLAALLTLGLTGHPGPAPSTLQQPARYVGYDCSAYAVASSLVVLCMAATEDIELDSVIQVWGSSCWSSTALRSFKRTVDLLLRLPLEEGAGAEGAASRSAQRGPPPPLPRGVSASALTPAVHDVLGILRERAGEPERADAARERWHTKMPCTDRAFRLALGMRAEEDRVAFARYVLTGEIPVSTTASVGSVLMTGPAYLTSREELRMHFELGRPLLLPPRPDAEVFFHLLPMMELILPGRWRAAGAAGEEPLPPPLMGECVDYLRAALGRVRRWLAAGRLEVSLAEATFQPRAAALLSSVRSMAPASMSWSNVPDYCSPEDFHAMAAACSAAGASAPTTLHYLTAMNWLYSVYGVSVLEVPAEQRKAAYASGLQRMEEGRQRQDPRGYLAPGFAAIDAVQNAVSYAQRPALAAAWVEQFCARAGRERRPQVVRLAHDSPGAPYALHRVDSNIHLVLRYPASIPAAAAQQF